MNPAHEKANDADTNESSQIAHHFFSSFGVSMSWVLLLSLLIGACESGSDLPRPAPKFAEAGLPGDWIPDPQLGELEATFANKEGITALKLTAKEEHTFVGRRLDVSLIAGPYLRWAWYLEMAPHRESGNSRSGTLTAPRNPLRLRIAFHGGPREKEDTRNLPWVATGVPSYDRLLDLVWEWQSATYTKAGGAHLRCSIPCIPIQKRLGDTNQWWLEAADLEKIYRHFWPEDYLTEVRVVFIALVLEPSSMPMVGYLADLNLRR